ncbi:hypothetical protein XENOCAPTIV_002396 [Xenoophorus captivus]|uniref:Uncharacterized protein n=1 Tax=Xenoophorus captivus TaxID=1517983 RepID=A0ABV0SCV4_9TELE
MSDKGTVSSKDKEATEKRGRGRPRKQPQVKSSDVSGPLTSICSLLPAACHMHCAVQVQWPQDCFQADTERPLRLQQAHSPSSPLPVVSIATTVFSLFLHPNPSSSPVLSLAIYGKGRNGGSSRDTHAH